DTDGEQGDDVAPAARRGRWRWGGANPLWRHVERPRQNERDRKANEKKHDHEAQGPRRQVPRRKDSGRQLDYAAGHDDISDGDAINFSPFNFFEETAHSLSITNLRAR